MKHAILLIHAFGRSAFDAEAVKAYGSLENLIASDTLAGIPDREKSLTQLWEAANIDLSDGAEDEKTEEAEDEQPA